MIPTLLSKMPCRLILLTEAAFFVLSFAALQKNVMWSFQAALSSSSSNELFTVNNISQTDHSTQQENDKHISWPFSLDNPKQVRIWFIHTGKAGGMSLYKHLQVLSAYDYLDCRIRAQNDSEIASDPCRYNNNNNNNNNPPRKLKAWLPQRMYGHLHRETNCLKPEAEAWLKQHANLLIFPVRDPVDRIVSAFNYHRNLIMDGTAKNPPTETAQFFQCFSLVDQFASSLDVMLRKEKRTIDRNETEQQCQTLGRNVLLGNVRVAWLEHFHFHYGHYAKRAGWSWGDNRTVAVIRTKEMWSDVGRLEGLMGGDPTVFNQTTTRVSHGSEAFQVQSGIHQPTNVVQICCLLAQANEMTMYEQLILSASNLSPAEKRKEVIQVRQHCNASTVTKTVGQVDFVDSWHDWHKQTCQEVI